MVGSECSGVVIAVDFNKIEKRIWPSQSYSTAKFDEICCQERGSTCTWSVDQGTSDPYKLKIFLGTPKFSGFSFNFKT
jgi:hypothetical protein